MICALSWLSGTACHRAAVPEPPPVAEGPAAGAQNFWPTGTPMDSLQPVLTTMNLRAWHGSGYRGQRSLVAILDNGFSGLDEALGRTLPPDLTIENPGEGEYFAGKPGNFHGTRLAEIVRTAATGTDHWDEAVPGPELRLFLTHGPYDKLRESVDGLIRLRRAHPDRPLIVLYSQIWEFGGNPGRRDGYINKEVSRALAAGVVWVNAAGNQGLTTWTDTPRPLSGGWLQMPGTDGGTRLPLDVTTGLARVKVVLGWNDFTDFYDHRTEQDLDLVLERPDGTELGRSELVQDGEDHGGAAGFSRHAREQLQASLPAGRWHLRVLDRSGNFTGDSRFWISVTGTGVRLPHSNGDRIVFMPANLPDVLTVGAWDVNYGNSLSGKDGGLLKPDVMAPSLLRWQDGFIVRGTSTAAALVAGALAVWSPVAGVAHNPGVIRGLRDGRLSRRDFHGVPMLRLADPPEPAP